jgi:cytidylate kinase
MCIITISRRSCYTRGRQIAELAAEKLGYEAVSRGMLLKSSEKFNVPEAQLVGTTDDGGAYLKRIAQIKDDYKALIQPTFLEYAKKNNIVYHGLAGHLMLPDVGHVLRVFVLASMQLRLQMIMKRYPVSETKALKIIERMDNDRRQWTLTIWGEDPWNLDSYDLVVRVDRLSLEGAADVICQAAQLEEFQVTPDSEKALEDLLLSS